MRNWYYDICIVPIILNIKSTLDILSVLNICWWLAVHSSLKPSCGIMIMFLKSELKPKRASNKYKTRGQET